MKAQVIYLNAWLDCGDEALRKNFRLQEMINEAKITFWYQLNLQGVNGYQAELCYDRWVHSNRDRIKVLDPV